jgi:hypothetical protein
LQALLAKIVYIFMLQSCMKQFFPTSEKDEWQWITWWKSRKMGLGKRQLRLNFWRNGCITLFFYLYVYIYTVNALV